MRQLASDLVRLGRFTTVAPYQRFGYVCAALLVAGGLFHGLVFLVDGGSWEGPLSWRKPIVFGLSFGIALATVAWVLGFLRPRRRAGWLFVGTYAFASVGEVVLISMQTWRGVPSHFNEAPDVNGLIFSVMGMLVSVIAVLTVALTVWALVRIDAPPSLAFAIRAGLVLMLASQLVGVQMIVEGDNTFGAEGALKVPHAVTLHAIQVLPALALLLLASDLLERRRVEILAVGAAGYAALIASTAVQAYSGRGPLDPGVVSTALALLGLGLLAVSAVFALRGVAARPHPPFGGGAAEAPRAP